MCQENKKKVGLCVTAWDSEKRDKERETRGWNIHARQIQRRESVECFCVRSLLNVSCSSLSSSTRIEGNIKTAPNCERKYANDGAELLAFNVALELLSENLKLTPPSNQRKKEMKKTQQKGDECFINPQSAFLLNQTKNPTTQDWIYSRNNISTQTKRKQEKAKR